MPHIHEKVDFTAEVFIVYNNKVLLRKHDKYKMWLSVGGHIELDEDPVQAAIREVKEEVGLDVELYQEFPITQCEGSTELIPPQFMNRHKINEKHEHISLVYFGYAKTNQLQLSEDEKSEGCHWFTQDELDDPQYQLSEHIKMYAKVALQKLRQ